jgi:hypothetical protein
MIGMTLRISGYSNPEVINNDSSNHNNDGQSVLPIIHVEGESEGGDTPGQRKVTGTVSMIADGYVRWSLVRTLFFVSGHL